MVRGGNLLEKIEKTRKLLYGYLDSKPIDTKEVLKASQELDKLILEYYRNNEINYKRENRF